MAIEENDVPTDTSAKDALTAEEIQRLSDMVPWGQAVTFPNGVTIDKRPLFQPPPVFSPGAPLNTGLTCTNCGKWTPNGMVHYCPPKIGS